jgi:hypothetical protein
MSGSRGQHMTKEYQTQGWREEPGAATPTASCSCPCLPTPLVSARFLVAGCTAQGSPSGSDTKARHYGD